MPKLVIPKGASPRQICALARIMPGALDRLTNDTLPGADVAMRTAVKYVLIACGFDRRDVKERWTLEQMRAAFNSPKCVGVYDADAWPERSAEPIPTPDKPMEQEPMTTPAPVPDPKPVPDPQPKRAPRSGLDGIIADIARGEIEAALANRPGLDVEAIRQIARDAARVTRVEIVLPGKAPENVPGTHHEAFPDLLRLVGLRKHTYLHGPAGSGKSTAARNAATALGFVFGSTGKVDSKYDLLGFRDAHGRTVRTPFREIWEFGGLFLFDEIDRSDPSAAVALNNGLATGALDFADGTIQRHTDCVIVAGGNTTMRGADRIYTAATAQDGSVADRFVFLPWGYDEELERILAGDDAGKWVSFVQNVRRVAKGMKIDLIASPRASIEGAQLLRAGFKRENVEHMVLWRGLDGASIEKIVKGMPS